MRAFEVYVNGKRLCVSGVGVDGVLTTHIDHAIAESYNETWISVSGLIDSREHVTWARSDLKVGDEVRLKVVETEKVDRPQRRDLIDHKTNLAQEKARIRKRARELGWQIVTRPVKKKKQPSRRSP